MPTTHTHYVPRPPVDEQPLTPNTLRAAASTLIFGRRPSAPRLSPAAQLPENTLQSILEFLDDDEQGSGDAPDDAARPEQHARRLAGAQRRAQRE